jgi:E3 ubiquitin-protein ligase TRIP12
LLQKLPAEYRPVLRREGVFHEIESLAARTLTSIKSKDSDGTIVSDPVNIPIHISSTIPGYKKLHSLSLEPEDAITLRARVIRFKYSLGQEEGDEDNAFDELRRLVDRLASPDVGESAMISALRDIADHFTSHSSVSSFELLQSGAVDGLLRFATNVTRSTGTNHCCVLSSSLIYFATVTSKRRQELLYDSFSRIPRGGTVTQSPLAVLVKKLQESLTRMEDFDVVTVSQGTDGEYNADPSFYVNLNMR